VNPNAGSERSQTKLWLVGQQHDKNTHDLREFLSRNRVPFEWVDVEHDAVLRFGAGEHTPGAKYPVCLFPDGSRLESPSYRALADKVGLRTRPSQVTYDLAIYGAGPAGLAAALYGASEGLRTVVFERDAIGGQAGTSSRIENYLGFAQGVSGAELVERAHEQAQRFGAEFVIANEGVGVDPTAHAPYRMFLADGSEVKFHAAVIAVGVTYRLLDAPGIAALTGRGVYYGTSISEATFYRDKNVFIVGSANSAGQAAVFLSSVARSVTLVVRGDSIEKDMSDYLIGQMRAHSNITVRLQTQVESAEGDAHLTELVLRDSATGMSERVSADGLFILIGQQPATEWLRDLIRRDVRGFLMTGSELTAGIEAVPGTTRSRWWPLERDPLPFETSVPGVFAVGDVRSGSTKRVATAVGEGATAVRLVHEYLAAHAVADAAVLEAQPGHSHADGASVDLPPFLKGGRDLANR